MKSISVKGYKAINKEMNISLAPINLIIGPNGSGKSTLINSLLLSKGLLRAEINDLYSFWNSQETSSNYDPKDMYAKGKYNLAFMPRLINPFDTVGKFKKTDINNNSKQKQISISLPIELKHFNDAFKIEFTYFIEKNNNAPLKGIKIINETQKSILFSNEIISEILNNECSCLVKIDVDYLIDFISKVKNENKNYKPIIFDEGSSYFQAEADLSYEEMVKAENLITENKKNFRDKLMNAFKDESKCELIDSQESNSSNPSYLLDYYNKILSHDLFNYSKEDNKTFNIKDDKAIYDIAMEYEKDWIKKIRKGYEVKIKASSFIDIFLKSIGEGELPFYINYPLNILENKLSLFNIKTINHSDESDFIFNQLLFRNLNNSLKKLFNETKDLVYIPPNRITNYKANKDFSNEDIVTSLINRLNNMQFEDKWAKPSEYFVNYWLNEFNLKNKVNFNSIDDIISFFHSNSFLQNKVKVDFGYGISQLIPLICLFSLFNDKHESFYNSDEEQNELRGELSNCYLIEEPEANLHPSFQSKLADLFIDAAWKFGHQFVIETHSEYMVRKFQYWVAKGKIKPSDINIYYFDNKNEDPLVKDLVIKKIKINKDGSLSEPFGEGFFDEATNWQFELLKIKNAQKN